MDRDGQKWTEMDRNRYGQRWIEMDRDGQRWTDGWTEMD